MSLGCGNGTASLLAPCSLRMRAPGATLGWYVDFPDSGGRYRHSRRVTLNNAASGTPTNTPSMPYDVTSSAALSGPALVANKLRLSLPASRQRRPCCGRCAPRCYRPGAFCGEEREDRTAPSSRNLDRPTHSVKPGGHSRGNRSAFWSVPCRKS